MRAALVSILLLVVFAIDSLAAPASQQATMGNTASFPAAEFDRAREAGNEALYNLEYRSAQAQFEGLTKLAPDHPAGFIYLANNLWLETLNSSRRLSSSLYSGGSFYAQDAEQDKSDPKRDREFNDLIRRAIEASKARLVKDPKDVEALYYQGAALGLRAGYSVTVKRSFRRAIGDANQSIQLQRKVIKLDPNYTDAYLSIGLYEYVIDSLPWIWRTLARLAGLSGSKKRGIHHLEMVTRAGKYTADDARVLLIGIYSREKQHDRALELVSSLANKYPRNFLFGVERAAMLYRLNRPDEGGRVFQDLLKNEQIARSATDLINYQWGEAVASIGNYGAAIERYNEVKRWAGSDKSLVSLAHLHAGQALDLMGRRAEALAEYQAVLKREKVFDSHKLAAQYIKAPYTRSKGA